MPEILTESFCERCGTRYTFESSAPRNGPLSGLKVLGAGLRNFVMSDDTTMDEAMAAARSEAERRATTQQLDAFHKTFNFCMTCRQYTCASCWNEAEAKCLTCAPHLGREIMPAPFPTLDPTAALSTADATDGNGTSPFEDAPPAWPTVDGVAVTAETEPASEPPEEIDLAARLRALDMTEAPAAPVEPVQVVEQPAETVGAVEPIEAVEPVAEPAVIEPAVVDAPEPAAADAPGPAVAATVEAPEDAAPDEAATTAPDAPPTPAADAQPVPASVDDRTAAARRQTADLLSRFRPGQSLDDVLEAFEREQLGESAQAPVSTEAAPAQAEVAPQPSEAPEPAAQPIAAAPPDVPGPQAEPGPQPEPVEPTPAAPPAEPVAAEAARDDRVEQPRWPVPPPTTPDGLPAPAAQPPAAPRPEPQWPTAPQWPSTPQWPTTRAAPSEGTILGRPVVPSGGIESLWAASAGEVLGAGLPPAEPGVQKPAATLGVQPCINCGLSLSSTARFCRRCGTPQAKA